MLKQLACVGGDLEADEVFDAGIFAGKDGRLTKRKEECQRRYMWIARGRPRVAETKEMMELKLRE